MSPRHSKRIRDAKIRNSRPLKQALLTDIIKGQEVQEILDRKVASFKKRSSNDVKDENS